MPIKTKEEVSREIDKELEDWPTLKESLTPLQKLAIACLIHQIRQDDREALIGEIEGMRKIHTHDSIPVYHDSECVESGCKECMRNVTIEIVLFKLSSIE